jgi:hypothetical protein
MMIEMNFKNWLESNGQAALKLYQPEEPAILPTPFAAKMKNPTNKKWPETLNLTSSELKELDHFFHGNPSQIKQEIYNLADKKHIPSFNINDFWDYLKNTKHEDLYKSFIQYKEESIKRGKKLQQKFINIRTKKENEELKRKLKGKFNPKNLRERLLFILQYEKESSISFVHEVVATFTSLMGQKLEEHEHVIAKNLLSLSFDPSLIIKNSKWREALEQTNETIRTRFLQQCKRKYTCGISSIEFSDLIETLNKKGFNENIMRGLRGYGGGKDPTPENVRIGGLNMEIINMMAPDQIEKE